MFPTQKMTLEQKNFFWTSKGPPFYASKNCKMQQSQLSLFTTLFLVLNLELKEALRELFSYEASEFRNVKMKSS